MNESADSPPQPRIPVTPRLLLDTKIPHAPHISPDGRRVVFGVNEADWDESRYVSRLYLADLPAGGADSAEETAPNARQITFSFEGEHAPRWSPDGRYIAFLSARPDLSRPPEGDEDEDPREQVWVLPADGGEAQRITTLREGVRAFEWTPDSAGIITLVAEARPKPIQFARDDARKRKIDPTVEQEERHRQQFWFTALADKKPELLYTGDLGIGEFALSPDGTQIAYTSNGTGDPNDYYQYDLYVLSLEPPEGTPDDAPFERVPRRLVERAGAKFAPQWASDGRRIAFIASLDPAVSYSQECLWVVDAAGGVPVNLFADLPYDVEEYVWTRVRAGEDAPAVTPLYATVADGTNQPLLRFVAEGTGFRHEWVTTEGEVVDCTGFDATVTGVCAAVLENFECLPELYLLQASGDHPNLTELQTRESERLDLPTQEVIRWENEGFSIEGIVTYPPGFSAENPPPAPLPLVVQIHGGPKGRDLNTLRSYTLHPAWATEGYLVLRVNFRGSEGYGNAFAVSSRRDLGGGDYRDILAGVDLLIARGLADPARLGIMGGSYGGYMTNWAVGQTDRFAAAISLFGIFDLVTDYRNSEIPRWDPDYLGALPWEDPEIYRRCSPATYLEQIGTPMLIVHGQSDTNTFIANSRELFRALKERGVPVQFVHYPREGHGLREPSHKMDEFRRCLAWFDRYLKGAGIAPPTYRLGDRVEHDGYELHLLSVEDATYAEESADEEAAVRRIEIAFSVASRDPVEAAWRFALSEMRLTDAADVACPLCGVPVEVGGGKILVEGHGLELTALPDKDSGRIGFGLSAVFQVPLEGGALTLRIADFPPLSLRLAPKDAEDDTDDEGETEPGSPPGALPHDTISLDPLAGETHPTPTRRRRRP